MKLYHYAPKETDILKCGLLSVSKNSEELKKYSKRAHTDDPTQIIAWLEKTFTGRSRSISVLTEPVCYQGNDPMLKEWLDEKVLIEIDYDALLSSGLIESVWCKRESDENGLNEKIIQIMPNEIDFSRLPWHLCSRQKGLFFGVIRHYFLVLKDGVIPVKYLKVIS